MRTLLATTALALCLGSISTAHADMKQLSKAGYWEADAGINDLGHQMCMVETYGTADDNSIIGFMVKYDMQTPEWVYLHIAKANWNIPANQRMRVGLTIDNAPGRIFNGSQVGRADVISIPININAIDTQTREPEVTYLFNLFRGGRQLQVSFPDGNEASWVIELNGAGSTINTMTSCMKYFAEIEQRQAPSQGAQSAPTTQPYGHQQQLPATQKTTQPYTPL